jgi:L-ornithine Nalpha-acyltransferase
MSMRCVVVRTPQELDHAVHVRWKVFSEEKAFIAPEHVRAAREINGFDTLKTTVHVVVYDNTSPVAAARLLLPNPEVARLESRALGLEIEEKFDLAPLVRAGLSLAEVNRLCVVKPKRRSHALSQLIAVMHSESRFRGVTHWISAANTDTDSLEDARLAVKLAQRDGLTSNPFQVKARVPSASIPGTRPLPFSEEERRRAERGDLTGLKLPGTLSLYTRKLSARIIGDPILDPRFNMCSVPLLAALDDLPALVRGGSRGET